MTDQTLTMKQARAIWTDVRAFFTLWVALTSLGGFVVLVGGPHVLSLLSGIFGPAAALPGRVITILMSLTLPFAVYFFISQKRLEKSTVLCAECGERFPKEDASCPMCGCVREDPSEDEQPAAEADS